MSAEVSKERGFIRVTEPETGDSIILHPHEIPELIVNLKDLLQPHLRRQAGFQQ